MIDRTSIYPEVSSNLVAKVLVGCGFKQHSKDDWSLIHCRNGDIALQFPRITKLNEVTLASIISESKKDKKHFLTKLTELSHV